MKKQIRSIIFGIALFGVAQVTCMQQAGNSYIVQNKTPDAMIKVAGFSVGPNSRIQLHAVDDDQIQILMTSNMNVNFQAPGSFLITLRKWQDPQCPRLPIYGLILFNRLTQRITSNIKIAPTGYPLAREAQARLVEITVEPRRVGAPGRVVPGRIRK